LDLKSKCAVITGGAMGIGFATAKRLIAEGCQVTLWDLNGSALEDAKKSLEKSGGRVFAHVCDVTDKARVYELAKQAVADMGKVDILVNNAGYVMGGDFIEQPDEVWEKTIAVNLTAFIYTIRAFLPGMWSTSRRLRLWWVSRVLPCMPRRNGPSGGSRSPCGSKPGSEARRG